MRFFFSENTLVLCARSVWCSANFFNRSERNLHQQLLFRDVKPTHRKNEREKTSVFVCCVSEGKARFNNKQKESGEVGLECLTCSCMTLPEWMVSTFFFLWNFLKLFKLLLHCCAFAVPLYSKDLLQIFYNFQLSTLHQEAFVIKRDLNNESGRLLCNGFSWRKVHLTFK